MKELIINLKNFPTTRYQGSKRKIIPWLYNNIKELEFNTVLDAFGGSASVSYMFKKMGKSVTYNDYLKFNFYIGKAIIENSNVVFTQKDLEFFKTQNRSDLKIVQKFFKDIYYYPSENKWIDCAIEAINSMNSYSKNILEYKKAIALYALFQSCLIKRPFNLFHRKNLYLRKNKVERSFGNFQSWNKNFSEYFERFINEANSLVFNNGAKCYAINKSIFELKKNKFDLIYFDPPYFKKDASNETSFYNRTYHFLEGLSNYTEWENLIDENTINKRFKIDKFGDEFGKEDLIKSFEKLFEFFNKSIIVISYKKGGKPSIETIVKLLKKNKNKVYTRSIHYKYALNHQNGDAINNREVLIIGL